MSFKKPYHLAHPNVARARICAKLRLILHKSLVVKKGILKFSHNRIFWHPSLFKTFEGSAISGKKLFGG